MENEAVEDVETRQASVACLYSIVELPKLCQSQTGMVKISAETNRYLLYLTVRKLGPILAKKLVKKLVDRGEVEFKLPAIDDVYEVEAVLDYAKEKDD
ncbi:hypothetical protein LSAT2_003839, partial [Lamellibrachia satsuma]